MQEHIKKAFTFLESAYDDGRALNCTKGAIKLKVFVFRRGMKFKSFLCKLQSFVSYSLPISDPFTNKPSIYLLLDFIENFKIEIT